ncbi:unnamed protein product [Prorocentrum cordatum]|uniref:Uncharacterized protein n=1 Tax=Prorocentrum cordatum TaxID=2364126 RepID=A0ABN9PDU8_9DINO|nr:unnamed protein product [Polarella glacialis]
MGGSQGLPCKAGAARPPRCPSASSGAGTGAPYLAVHKTEALGAGLLWGLRALAAGAGAAAGAAALVLPCRALDGLRKGGREAEEEAAEDEGSEEERSDSQHPLDVLGSRLQGR